jgi:cellulose synthase/poly-beta-1,6-N-acetylglucosamine synthase-like glycosyltransferase
MGILRFLLQLSSSLFAGFLYFIAMYYLGISFFGLVKFVRKKHYEPCKSFALIIAAHNEQTVIREIIDSLKRLDYPKELYDIFVIADNCSDKTAIYARNSGALVYERNDKTKRGKGYALEWMFEKIFKMEKAYDAVAVLDADNLVSKIFLTEMNAKLCEGYKVVQGYLDSKNPKDTWITCSYSIAFWTANRMFQLSRSNIGLSNQLGGTGFCIHSGTLKQLGWGATCLTEDLEFTCKLVLNGHKVGWAHDAVVYDEKPLTLRQSWYQRKRWMQGFADVSSRYFWPLMKRAVTKFDIAAFDCAIYSIQPVVIILAGIAMLISIFNYSMAAFSTDVKHLNIRVVIAALAFGLFLQFIYTPLMLILDKKLSLKIMIYYTLYPIYTATWIPISIKGIIDKNKTEWSHTLHTRSVNIGDLEKAN